MEAIMTTPSTQPMVSTPPPSNSVETKIEAKVTKQTIETNVQEQEHLEQDKHVVKPQEVTKEFNDISDSLNLDVKFAYNEKIDQVYISVTDKETGKVIRKLPTEEAMKIKESMKDLVGVLFDKKG